VAKPAPITVDELLELHRLVKEQARLDPSLHYEDLEHRGPSASRLVAIVAAVPALNPSRTAAWLLRAIILVQPFPDGHHRTALMAAEVVLGRAGIRFRPGPDEAAAFQKEVTARRYRLLGGYDDAPLAILGSWEDEAMECCERFVGGGSSAKAP